MIAFRAGRHADRNPAVKRGFATLLVLLQATGCASLHTRRDLCDEAARTSELPVTRVPQQRATMTWLADAGLSAKEFHTVHWYSNGSDVRFACLYRDKCHIETHAYRQHAGTWAEFTPPNSLLVCVTP